MPCIILLVVYLVIQVVIALVVQFLWNSILVPMGVAPISLIMAWLIAVVLSIIFRGSTSK